MSLLIHAGIKLIHVSKRRHKNKNSALKAPLKVPIHLPMPNYHPATEDYRKLVTMQNEIQWDFNVPTVLFVLQDNCVKRGEWLMSEEKQFR